MNASISPSWASVMRPPIGLFAIVASLFLVQSSSGDLSIGQSNQDGVLTLTYKLTITPAAEPQPAFKHRLTVSPNRTIPANAITYYLRSFGENQLRFLWKAAEDQSDREVIKWLNTETPLGEVPIEKLRGVTTLFDRYVDNFVEPATRCRYADWGIGEEDLTSTELTNFLLPSVQQTRSISRVLALRTRLAIAEGRYDDAIANLRMNYQLGQNVAKMKFLVAAFVASAEIGIADSGMLEMIAAPDSPNMYWALAELPRPIVNFRESIRLQFAIRLSHQAVDVETAQLTDERWAQLLIEAQDALREVERTYGIQSLRKLDTQSTVTLVGLANYTAAKRRLVQQGLKPSVIDEMCVAQVLLIEMHREYQRIANLYEKALYIAYPDSLPIVQQAEAALKERTSQPAVGRMLIDQDLSFTLYGIKLQNLNERKRNVLQTIEAIRMHLADTGALPEKLSDIQVVPVPIDPMTNQPFKYHLQNGVAVIELPKPDVGLNQQFTPERYELEVAK